MKRYHFIDKMITNFSQWKSPDEAGSGRHMHEAGGFGLDAERRGRADAQALTHHSASASLRVRSTAGDSIATSRIATTPSSTALIGRVTKTLKSPSDSSMARRKFSSSCGPRTRPSSNGAGSTPDLDEEIAHDREAQHQPDIEQAVGDAERADAAEQHDGREQQAVGDLQHRRPTARSAAG